MRGASFYRLAAARRMEIFQAARRKEGKKGSPEESEGMPAAPGDPTYVKRNVQLQVHLPRVPSKPHRWRQDRRCEQRMRCWSASFPICSFTSGLRMQSRSGASFPHAAASISRLWAAGKETQLFHKTSLKGLITSTPGTQETWIPGLNFRESKTRRPAVRVSINTLCKSSGPALNSAVLLKRVFICLPRSQRAPKGHIKYNLRLWYRNTSRNMTLRFW
ncbi:uncharacterized protein LOC113972093 [Neopelma chrysocephalum]|uniref:uncharacterized protein LOC113972093 n=1 Tax=Neopelma chrysocephalum TaxID=114329 RepID=UPI000FCCEAC1|nr:uncharacterized protein LOC113972093 [Neopelma chrysocephalum]